MAALRLTPKISNTLAALCAVFSLSAAFYPSNHQRDYAHSRGGAQQWEFQLIEHYGRHINTVAMVAVPLIQRDPAGLLQLLQAGALTTLVTQGGKRVLNSVVVDGTRLGQRPLNPNTRYNMPSGHSSLASFAAFFVSRRYGWRWLWLLLTVALLTMWTRVELDMHTVSAVWAGFFIGPAVCLWWVRPRAQDAAPQKVPTSNAPPPPV